MRISLDKFKVVAASNEEAAKGLSVSKALVVEAKAEEGDGARTIRVRASTAAPDRDNDTINVHGWELGNFTKNGPFLWAHDAKALPIGRSLRTWVEDGALKSTIQFPTEEEAGSHFAFVDSVYRLYKSGYLNAVSVGFMPLEYKFNEERGDFAFDFMKQELMEISAVPVPANPEALVEARKSIDLAPLVEWAEKILDGGKGPGLWLPVSKEKLERAHKAAQIGAPVIVDLGATVPAMAPPPVPVPTPLVTAQAVEVTAPIVAAAPESKAIDKVTANAVETVKASGVELEPNFWEKIDAIVHRSLDRSLRPALTGQVD